MATSQVINSISHGPDDNLWAITISIAVAGVTTSSLVQDYQAGGVLGSGNTPFTHPGVPGSGSNFVTLQFNTTTGVASLKSATDTYPAADSGCVAYAQQAVDSGQDNIRPCTWPGWQFLF